MAAALAILSACTQPEKATRILKAEGYDNIQMTGFDFLMQLHVHVFFERIAFVTDL